MSDITVDYVTCSMQIVVIVSAVYVLRLIIPRRDIVSHAFVLSFGTLLISLLTIVALLGDSAYVGRTSRALATAVYDVFRSLRPAEQRHDLSIDQSVVDDSEQTGLALNLLFGSIAEHLPTSITAKPLDGDSQRHANRVVVARRLYCRGGRPAGVRAALVEPVE